MKRHITLVFLLLFTLSCRGQEELKHTTTYPRHVGDIEEDSKIDDLSFAPCFSDSLIYQYFNMSTGLQYEGEKIAIDSYFQKHYTPVESDQLGWIRVRFIVNCNGETGRFRVLESDENFVERSFDERISSQLLSLTKELKGWKTIYTDDGTAVDYYQYLSFKIDSGQITKILP